MAWDYYSSLAAFEEARRIVIRAVDGCDAIIVNGFSNGGAFAAKLFCDGETFGNRLIRVVLDDPVPDRAVVGCRPDPLVGVHLYWTGALDYAHVGFSCIDAELPCQDGTAIGIAAYAACLSTSVRDSPHSTHTWFKAAPETRNWRRHTRSSPTTGTATSRIGLGAECP
jgi:hypothetical protein